MADKHARDRGAWLRLLEAPLDQPQPSPELRAAIAALTGAQRGGPGHCTPRLSRVQDVLQQRRTGTHRQFNEGTLRRAIDDVKSRRGALPR